MSKSKKAAPKTAGKKTNIAVGLVIAIMAVLFWWLTEEK